MSHASRCVRWVVALVGILVIQYFSTAAWGALTLAPIFSSNMVLQRNAAVPIFGTADPGATVTVQFGNQNVSAVANSTGRWQANLGSMNASATPSSLVVTGPGAQITCTGVQVGEVWLFSGQSNMDMTLNEAAESAPYIADAPNRNIRLFLMKAGNGPATTTWKVADSTTAAAFSAVGYWTGLELSKKLNIPIGLIQATHDGTNISEWQTTNGGSGSDYLAMVKPIQPLAIKGIGWYQGESNGGDAAYETKLTAMISEWRTDWGATLPFGIVQLPASKWTAARIAQYNVTQKVASTFLVVTHDLPGSSQLHPTAKKLVGMRMGLGARATVYGEAIEYSGPVPALALSSISGNTITLGFTHVGNGLTTSDGLAPSAFQIAGADGRFQAATATLAGNTIRVSSSRVATPKMVRYGFSATGNLFNVVNVPIEGGTASITRLPGSLFDVRFP